MEHTQETSGDPAPESGLRLSLMGSEGSGKTCFFAGLSWLGSAETDSDFGLVARDEPSQAFVNGLRETLARGELPAPTHRTDGLELDVIFRGSRIGIGVEDFAGEDFRDMGTGLKSGSPLFEKLRGSQYIVLFLDIENDVDRASDMAAERLDAVLNLLSTESLSDGTRKLAVVLTKSDLRGFTGPGATSGAARAFLKSRQPGLFRKMNALGYEKRFFFLASIGRPSLDGRPPEPFGYENLFSWLVEDLRLQRILEWCRRHWLPLAAGALVAVLGAGYAGVRQVQRVHADAVLANGTSTWPQRTDALGKASKKVADRAVSAWIEEVRGTIGGVDTLEGLSKIQSRVAGWEGFGSKPVEERRAELERALRGKREDLHLHRMLELEGNRDFPGVRNAISEYFLDKNCSRLRESEVSAIGQRLEAAERSRRRAEIRAIVVESGHPEKLKARCDGVAGFPFPDPVSRKEAERAVAVARLFLADAPYHIEIRSAAGLPSAHRTRLEFSNLGPSSLQQVETEHVKSRNPQWNEKAVFRWKPGDRVKVEWLWSSHWGPADTTIGEKTFADPWTSLLDALGGVDLTPRTGAGHARLGGNIPSATIVCGEFPNPKNDAALFRKYIAPGTYWQD